MSAPYYSGDGQRPKGWLRDELERARTRLAALPKWARPIVTRPTSRGGR